jgi:hypothetical protein
MRPTFNCYFIMHAMQTISLVKSAGAPESVIL